MNDFVKSKEVEAEKYDRSWVSGKEAWGILKGKVSTETLEKCTHGFMGTDGYFKVWDHPFPPSIDFGKYITIDFCYADKYSDLIISYRMTCEYDEKNDDTIICIKNGFNTENAMNDILKKYKELTK